MSFDLFNNDPNPPSGPGASSVVAEVQRRRNRQRVIVGTAASLALVLLAAIVLRSPDESRPVVADEPDSQQAIGVTTIPGNGEPMSTEPTTTTTTSRTTTTRRGLTGTTFPPPSTTSTTLYGSNWVSYPGTAQLTFSGVQSGQLANTVASCNPRPGASSDIEATGTLNGTPWILNVQSYTGEMGGAYQVYTGKHGGGTGLEKPYYSTRESYPKTLSGVTNVDWRHGATLDIDLQSQDDSTPAGTVHVTGSINCP